MRWPRSILAVLLVLTVADAAYAATGPLDEQSRNILRWQIALERAGFSPGILDAKSGPRLLTAIAEFQKAQGLPPTTGINPSAAHALQVDDFEAVRSHTIDALDAASVTGPTPKSWPAKAQATALGYQSIVESLCERFHCTAALLQRLNAPRDLNRLKLGDTLLVPAPQSADLPRIARLEINQGEKLIRGFDSSNQLVALLHCSIAVKREKRPSGPARIVSITTDPVYRFDPVMWPEVQGVDRILMIPPGPRNPVGRCWIALSLKGYGIHGTPTPELIGKTGSHGCIRLTNWDALRLAKSITPGASVLFLPEKPRGASAPPSAPVSP